MFTNGSVAVSGLPSLRGLAVAALLASPLAASARTILVIACHPDDEALIAAGRVRSAIRAGDTAKIAIMTNGDILGVESGYLRETESVAAAELLGLTDQDVIFMGYGDATLLELYQSADGSQVFTSPAGRTATYGDQGLGGMEYHRHKFGVPGPYTRDTVLQDLEALIADVRPDEIYTMSDIDYHPDHYGTSEFVVEALVALERQGQALPTRLYHALVWGPEPSAGFRWPQLDEAGFTPTTPFTEPDCCVEQSTLSWSRIQRFLVPPEMQSLDPATNLKYQTILGYTSQTGGAGGWLTSFARRDEFFWMTDVGANKGLTATVTASSQTAAGAASNVVDGHADQAHSWISSEGAGAWIRLSWGSPVVLSEVDLQDAIETWNNVRSGTLSFSDGSTIAVGALPVGGPVLPVPFSPRTVTWVQFTIDAVDGTAGLSEMAALGPAASGNTPPLILSGPLPDIDPIYAWETALFTVDATDPDGDGLTAAWSADGGTIQGSGATAVFRPPAVSSPTIFTIAAQLDDAHGGVTSNVGFVTVLPSFDAVGIDPGQVLGGGSAQGLVTLASAAPGGGLTVSLSSSDPSVIVPASVAIPAGALSGSFPVTTASVGSTVQVTISAQIPTRPVQTASLTVLPPLAATNLAPSATVTVSSQAAGQPGTAAVDGVVSGFPLDSSREWAAVGASGQWIQLTWPSPVYLGGIMLHDRINLTDQILAGRLVFSDGTTVPVGALANDGTGLMVRFPERSVSSVRLLIDRDYGYNTGLAEFRAYAPLTDALTLSPTAVGGGGSVQGRVILALPAASGGEAIQLSCSDPAASVPASVTVPAGSTTATFTVTTQVVSEPHTATITASFTRGARSASLLIAPVTLSGLSFSPTALVGGGGALGTVRLSVAAPADLTVSLASSDPAVVVPSTVTVAAGAFSSTFLTLTGAVSSLTQATVTATLAASHAAADLLLFPALGDVNLARSAQATASSPAPGSTQDASKAIDGVVDGYPNDATREWATAGERAGAWIQLDWTTPVTLEEARLYDRPNDYDHVLSGRLLFSDGSTVAVGDLPNDASSPFLVDFEPRTVSWVRFVVDSATAYNIGLAELELYGPAAATSSFTASPSSVRAGGLVTGTVNLGAVAPAGGIVVPLASSDAALPVPPSVTVPQGAHSATFTALAGPVSVATVVTLTASLPGATRTAAVTVLPPAVSTLTLAPSSVTEGAPAEGTVTLDQAAGPGGMLVQLASDSAAAVVPASVAIPPGQSSAAFAVSTGPVSASTAALITATAGGAVSASLTVNPVPLASVAVTPASLVGGASALGTVALAAPAIGAGAVVSLSSSDPALVVPSSVTVAAGSTAATFPVTTFAVSTSTPVTITASRGVARTAAVTVLPPALAQLTLSPSSIVEGASASGMVTLAQPAGASGVTVALTSSNPSALAVPAGVTIAAGQTTATFGAVAGAVGAATPADVTAATGGATRTATVTVTPVAVTGLSISPGSVMGGTSASGTVTLAVPALLDTVVSLSDDSAAAAVPATVTVPAGASTATFTVTTAVVATTATVTITASRAGSSVTATLTVTPPALSALSLAATTLVGGSSTTGTITLGSAAPSGGLTVSLHSGNEAAVSVPDSVTVAAGASSATSRVTTTPVSSDTGVTLTATVGAGSRDATLTVQAPRPRSLSFSPATVTGTQTTTGTVRLTGVAPAGGTVVALASSNPDAAAAPATVTVVAGSTTATFTVQTAAVTSNLTITVTATAAGTSVQSTFSTRLLAVSSINLSPNSLTGGFGSTGAVMLTRPALAGGFTVTLASSNPAAAVPVSVTVPAGASTATFPVTTTAVAARTTSSISASGGGVTRSATLTISP